MDSYHLLHNSPSVYSIQPRRNTKKSSGWISITSDLVKLCTRPIDMVERISFIDSRKYLMNFMFQIYFIVKRWYGNQFHKKSCYPFVPICLPTVPENLYLKTILTPICKIMCRLPLPRYNIHHIRTHLFLSG